MKKKEVKVEEKKPCYVCGECKDDVIGRRLVSLFKYDLCDDCYMDSFRKIRNKSLGNLILLMVIALIGLIISVYREDDYFIFSISVIIDIFIVLYKIFPNTTKTVDETKSDYINDMYFYSSYSGNFGQAFQTSWLMTAVFFGIKLIVGAILAAPFVSYHLIVTIYSILVLLKVNSKIRLLITLVLTVLFFIICFCIIGEIVTTL